MNNTDENKQCSTNSCRQVERNIIFYLRMEMTGSGCDLVVEPLLSMCEVLGSILSSTKKQNRKEKKQ
jgi:hypothetical protein